MTDSPASRKHGKNAFFFVLVTVAIDMLGFGLIIPVVPSLVQEMLHIPPEDATLWLGTLAATYALMNFIFGPIVGALSDRFGRRLVLLVSIGTLVVDFLIMGIAGSIWLLFIGRALSGISGATYSTANAYIADVTEPENRGKAFGMIGAAFGFGFVFGPVIGGFLGEISPRAPFFAAAGLAALNFCYGLFVLPESLAPEDRRPFDIKRANPFGAVKHFSKLPQISWFLVAAGMFFLAHTVFPGTWSVHGEIRYDWSPKQIGFSLGLVGIGAAVVQAGLMGMILKRLGTVRTALLGMGTSIVSLSAFAFAEQGWMVYAIIPLGAHRTGHQFAYVDADTPQCAGRAARRQFQPELARHDHRPTHHEWRAVLFHPRECADPFRRRGLPAGRGAHRHSDRAIPARRAREPLRDPGRGGIKKATRPRRIACSS